MIYDFGMSKKIKKNNIKYLVSDYAGIISAFLNEIKVNLLGESADQG